MNTGWRYVVKQFGLLGLVALLCLFFLALGLVIGYGVIGDGKNPFSILSLGTWHDLIGKFTGN
ncbi:MAG: DNA-directed RNA polymerase subunit beta [Streptococcus hyointestinalis]|uniref:DNA-directed RNA polymerase subunit beta n=1 Tax=Streptococcus hyointestinalis TaxID=1337 RepID=UPI0023EFE103|nr:DNA-directed RNA polymerase subunit beta [Streptococcus hyointestinalis]MCI6872502.1 DNA-directed RNA polymerase subunit beta [Streptococcus hyointestinalis]MDD7356376.1 DNA-directed RNA polymerase subunit beta [Streptococcus hyointestinalis]MDY4554095.1 DNA-directed RNA polymerase subunit beta [Streptococcus hyointestinalis]